jgi:hypothetical protein
MLKQSILLVARRLLVLACLGAGAWLLLLSWDALTSLGLNRGLGYPRYASRGEITFWHALPGFQAGMLAGMVAFRRAQGIWALLHGVGLGVWVASVANVGIIFCLARSGAFLR